MANVRDLKKEINHVLGDIIGISLDNGDPVKDKDKIEAIIDEVIETFDELIAKVNAKDVENKKAHFNAIRSELESRGRDLIDKVNKL